MDDNFEGGVDWSEATNMREMNRPPKKEPRVDKEVSKILGKPIMVNDPRLIRLVVAWKNKTASSAENVEKMDNYLYNPDFLAELHKVFG